MAVLSLLVVVVVVIVVDAVSSTESFEFNLVTALVGKRNFLWCIMGGAAAVVFNDDDDDGGGRWAATAAVRPFLGVTLSVSRKLMNLVTCWMRLRLLEPLLSSAVEGAGVLDLLTCVGFFGDCGSSARTELLSLVLIRLWWLMGLLLLAVSGC